MCWEENHNYKLDDEIKDRATLIKPLRRRHLGGTNIGFLYLHVFLGPVKAKEKSKLSMEKADNVSI